MLKMRWFIQIFLFLSLVLPSTNLVAGEHESILNTTDHLYQGETFAFALNRSIKVTNLANKTGDISKSIKARTISCALRNGMEYAEAFKAVNGAGNIWDDIVLKGNKGVVEALSSQYKNIDEYLAGAEYATKVSTDFVKYQARGGTLDLLKYTNKHKVITGNRMRGKIAESVFQDLEKGIKPDFGIQTSDGVRYVDNLLDGSARELKSGRITNTTDFQRQVKKDIEIIAQSRSSDVSKIEWHALDGIDDNALKFIRDEMTKQGVSANSFKVVVY